MIGSCNVLLSKPHDVRLGVSQGTVLGPLLFLSYANHLPQCLMEGKLTMLADDTKINISGKI